MNLIFADELRAIQQQATDLAFHDQPTESEMAQMFSKIQDMATKAAQNGDGFVLFLLDEYERLDKANNGPLLCKRIPRLEARLRALGFSTKFKNDLPDRTGVHGVAKKHFGYVISWQPSLG